jgi:hypothetical protein
VNSSYFSNSPWLKVPYNSEFLVRDSLKKKYQDLRPQINFRNLSGPADGPVLEKHSSLQYYFIQILILGWVTG